MEQQGSQEYLPLDWSYLEYPRYANEIILELQDAVMTIDEPLSWTGDSGDRIYTAYPIDKSGISDVPYGRLHKMNAFYANLNLNTWLIQSYLRHENDSNITVDKYLVTPGRMLAAQAITSVAIFDTSIDTTYLNNSLNDDLIRNASENPNPETIDYAKLFNALHDLAPYVSEAHDARVAYKLNQTKEEKRAERALEIEWLKEPEIDKISGPKWWGVSFGPIAYLVKASSAVDALLDVEENIGRELGMAYVIPHEDELQNDIDEKYPDDSFMRVIPFSLVRWPENIDELTDEQKEAFEALRPPEDGSI